MNQSVNIPRLDARDLRVGDVLHGATKVGFLTLSNTRLGARDVAEVIAAYRDFFHQPVDTKRRIDMAHTGSNRGWGAPHAEQVDPDANPDYKEVFDMGFQLPSGDPLAAHGVKYYAPNLWPADMPDFRNTIESYYATARAVAMDLLRALAGALGEAPDYFASRFDRPMALLRGNYYPPRPKDAGARDFGIAAHTDYGCLTLLATDGTPGLEVQARNGDWVPLSAPPGEFIINFGEMIEMWTNGRVIATPHRVIGTAQERLSVPLFFNPNYDTNVAPMGSDQTILAGDHLSRRYDETYVHLAS